MYIESAPNRNSAPAVLLRESYRQDGKVKKRTLANLSALPGHLVEGLKVLLRGGVAVALVSGRLGSGRIANQSAPGRVPAGGGGMTPGRCSSPSGDLRRRLWQPLRPCAGPAG